MPHATGMMRIATTRRTTAHTVRVAGLAAAVLLLAAPASAGAAEAPGGSLVPSGSLAPVGSDAPIRSAPPAASEATPAHAVCALADDPDPPEYYAFPLVTTKRVPEARIAEGTGAVTFVRSPFGVAVAEDGSYDYELHLSLEKLREPVRGTWVAWVTTPELDRIERIGAIGEDGIVRGQVAWNKFLVVITLEESDDPEAATWSGPVALRGMSRSGKMHTMAGHGPFQQENCAAYGYGG